MKGQARPVKSARGHAGGMEGTRETAGQEGLLHGAEERRRQRELCDACHAIPAPPGCRSPAACAAPSLQDRRRDAHARARRSCCASSARRGLRAAAKRCAHGGSAPRRRHVCSRHTSVLRRRRGRTRHASVLRRRFCSGHVADEQPVQLWHRVDHQAVLIGQVQHADEAEVHCRRAMERGGARQAAEQGVEQVAGRRKAGAGRQVA